MSPKIHFGYTSHRASKLKQSCLVKSSTICMCLERTRLKEQGSDLSEPYRKSLKLKEGRRLEITSGSCCENRGPETLRQDLAGSPSGKPSHKGYQWHLGIDVASLQKASTHLAAQSPFLTGPSSPNFRAKDPSCSLRCARWPQWPVFIHWRNLPSFQEPIHQPVLTESSSG